VRVWKKLRNIWNCRVQSTRAPPGCGGRRRRYTEVWDTTELTLIGDGRSYRRVINIFDSTSACVCELRTSGALLRARVQCEWAAVLSVCACDRARRLDGAEWQAGATWIRAGVRRRNLTCARRRVFYQPSRVRRRLFFK